MTELFRYCKQQKRESSVINFMSIKFHPSAESVRTGRYAVAAPRASDMISGALRQAFEAPGDERDLMNLLGRIDLADRARSRHA